jgi:hypothetical protein
VVALLTRSLGQREAEKASIRSPFPEGRNRQVVSTDVKSDAKRGGCQSAAADIPRLTPVIASEAKQSIASKRKNGLLRRYAPRNDDPMEFVFPYRYFFTLLASILIDVSRNLVVNAVSTANGFSMPR